MDLYKSIYIYILENRNIKYVESLKKLTTTTKITTTTNSTKSQYKNIQPIPKKTTTTTTNKNNPYNTISGY